MRGGAKKKKKKPDVSGSERSRSKASRLLDVHGRREGGASAYARVANGAATAGRGWGAEPGGGTCAMRRKAFIQPGVGSGSREGGAIGGEGT